jgi:hypothetical protein
MKTAVELLEDVLSEYFGKELEQFRGAFQLAKEIEMDKTNTDAGWIPVTDSLPRPLQTVLVANGKGWASIGCLVESDGGWHWAESNGVIYCEDNEIVSECESADLDVQFWHELPKAPII